MLFQDDPKCLYFGSVNDSCDTRHLAGVEHDELGAAAELRPRQETHHFPEKKDVDVLQGQKPVGMVG